MKALARANEVRLARAALSRQIRALPPAEGAAYVADVLLAPPPEMATMSVEALLGEIHRWGDSRSRKALLRAQVREGKAVGSLTPRQAKALAQAILPVASHLHRE